MGYHICQLVIGLPGCPYQWFPNVLYIVCMVEMMVVFGNFRQLCLKKMNIYLYLEVLVCHVPKILACRKLVIFDTMHPISKEVCFLSLYKPIAIQAICVDISQLHSFLVYTSITNA